MYDEIHNDLKALKYIVNVDGSETFNQGNMIICEIVTALRQAYLSVHTRVYIYKLDENKRKFRMDVFPRSVSIVFKLLSTEVLDPIEQIDKFKKMAEYIREAAKAPRQPVMPAQPVPVSPAAQQVPRASVAVQSVPKPAEFLRAPSAQPGPKPAAKFMAFLQKVTAAPPESLTAP